MPALRQVTMCTSVHPWTRSPAMNLARHHSVDIEMGKGCGPIQTVRIVCKVHHKYVSGFPIDWTRKYWSRLLMLRLFLSEGETDSESDSTSWVSDLHWFSSILRAKIYFRHVYSLRTPSLRRSWPRNVILTCFQHFFCSCASWCFIRAEIRSILRWWRQSHSAASS